MIHRPDLVFESKFSNNALIILDCTSAKDLQTARRLADDLANIVDENDAPYCHYFKINSAEEFFRLLGEILTQVANGLRPVLHIDGHGDKSDGLEIGESGETVSWKGLIDIFRKINTASGNNLGVVMSTCFGLYAITPVDIKSQCPFYFLIGPDKPVTAGYIDDRMLPFYSALIQTRSLDVAMAVLDSEFRQFHSERFFCIAFGKYLKQKCFGSGGRQRIERLITEAMNSTPVKTRKTLRILRRSAKEFVRSPKYHEAAFTRAGERFLHGTCPVTFDALYSFVKATDA